MRRLFFCDVDHLLDFVVKTIDLAPLRPKAFDQAHLRDDFGESTAGDIKVLVFLTFKPLPFHAGFCRQI